MAASTHWIMQPVNSAIKTAVELTNATQRVARIISAFSINSGNNPGTTARAAQTFAPASAFATTATNQIVLESPTTIQYNVGASGYALSTGYDVLFLQVQYEGVQPGTPGQ